ncbi:hypothetical protein CAP51_08245 [Acinetobacter populi]|uniref:phosphomannomutase n=1 Tax=Acinetobacter populi TaxID=1582270 RepID=A0A1Z9YZS4_9GAMM|nr:hypothetical protein CAP51_08245 [Acinetobacter populi]
MIEDFIVNQLAITTNISPQWAVSRKIFRAYDIRGHVDLLTAELVYAIALALATEYREQQQKQVVLGYDARLSSPKNAEMMAQALTASGLDVIEIGCVSSPLLYFTALQHGGNGIMITASHNPAHDNGIKWLIKGLPPSPEQIQQVADRIEQQDFIQGNGCLTHGSALPHYIDFLRHDICLSKNLAISLEGLNGSAGAIALAVLQQFGCKVDALHCHADGHFPLGAPDPSHPERLQALAQSVITHQSLMGIALDGDGDRLVVVDEQGDYVSPDRLLCLFAKICLLQHANAEIVCDVKCSSKVGQTVQQYAGRLTMIRTGSSFLRNYLYRHQAIFGGEFAGHYVFNDGRGKGFDDGLYAALRLLEYLSSTKQRLSQVLAEFPERVASKDIYIACDGVDCQQILAQIEQSIDLNTVHLCKVDGIRLDFPFGFGIIRPSNTGEYFTVRFDADSPAHFDEIRQIFVTALGHKFSSIAQAITQITY